MIFEFFATININMVVVGVGVVIVLGLWFNCISMIVWL
jgi:hypothetical protein